LDSSVEHLDQEERTLMLIRDGSDAESAAAVVQRVLHQHGLPFEPRRLDGDRDGHDRALRQYGRAGATRGGDPGRNAPWSRRVPGRPAGRRRVFALTPSFA
jgi:hypothetical protein